MADILVIDDEPLVRKTVRLTLARDGHAVVEADNGVAGLRECRTRAFDLVISDILMPGKEGIETIQELRATYPALKILAMSGGGRTANADFLTIAGKLGANDTLRKPFDPDVLRDKVTRLCGRG